MIPCSSSYTPSTRASRKSSSNSSKYRPSYSEQSSRKSSKVNVKELLKQKHSDPGPSITLEEREVILVENVDEVQGASMKQALYGM